MPGSMYITTNGQEAIDVSSYLLRCFHEANGRNDRDGVRLNRFAGRGKA